MSAAPETVAWAEFRSPDGRAYWYRADTKESVWEKPAELKSKAEIALSDTPWKEYDSNGRKYWYNADDKTTTWEMPEQVKQIMATLPPEAHLAPSTVQPAQASPGLAAPAFVPATFDSNMIGGGQLVAAGGFLPGSGGLSSSVSTAPLGSMRVDFNKPEDAKNAFNQLLRLAGVNPTWTWERTMRDLITEPMFKSLRTMGERKAAFEAYIADFAQREKDARQKSIDRLRPAWKNGLGRAVEAGMKSWWSWERTKAELSRNMSEMWSSARNDDERRTLWSEYIAELKGREETKRQQVFKSNVDKVHQIIASLHLELSTSWRDARYMIERSDDWRADPELNQFELVHVLGIFEEYAKKLEQESFQERQKLRAEKTRNQRKRREAFADLLLELRKEGQIKAGSKWKDVYPLFDKDTRYTDLLGNPGSNPLDLFHDVVDELDQVVEEHAAAVESALKTQAKAIDTAWTIAELKTHLADSKVILTDDQLSGVLAFVQIREAAKARAEVERQERRKREKMDDLRFALRNLRPAIAADSTYEEAEPMMKDLREFKALEAEDLRKLVFESHISRQKEKLRERERERTPSDAGSRGGESVHSGGGRESSRARRRGPFESRPDHRSSRRSLEPSPRGDHDSRRRHTDERRSDRHDDRRPDERRSDRYADERKADPHRSRRRREATEEKERTPRREADREDARPEAKVEEEGEIAEDIKPASSSPSEPRSRSRRDDERDAKRTRLSSR
ncbi:uncharacterized protein L969DRAFT_86773 [Mixia osmundae IAM 14324]|uniref:WW domain-containing protein n=1 Tax=Mixia osmundae (strain CBS 9802 / IAM 14324 / JCM 22182 / KY 12970) TaxID=764103 RepID=G7E8P1_MIXOS|nr:uncharacterized protein L969DRAFT_86773 [Mixia osmundae IAM 14324]KEI40145.1 hypothetical protein L969DRAFT_86773 [Mixia osmundae IAM 14324]GAA99509.1 hypothetical protein E5Q_06210 [Mixia osmundae IAM 14324]